MRASRGLQAGARLFGFGSRTSGALISLAPPANFATLATALARDVVLFEQQGCLSPHHIFIADADGAAARDFATFFVGRAMNMFAATLPPATLSFNAAAAIRRFASARDGARSATHRIELFEGADLAWTVVFDPRRASRSRPAIGR